MHIIATWRAGKVLLFDDSFIHSVSHEGAIDRPRPSLAASSPGASGARGIRGAGHPGSGASGARGPIPRTMGVNVWSGTR